MLGMVFCYLAGTAAGVWLTGLNFSVGFILTLLAITFAIILSAFSKYKDGDLSRGRNDKLAIAANYSVFFAIFMAGWLAVDLRVHSPSARDISALMDKPREGVELIGIVSDDPALRKNWRGEKVIPQSRGWIFGEGTTSSRSERPGGRPAPPKTEALREKKYWSFGMQVEAVSRIGVFQKARGDVQVRLPQNEAQPRQGEPCSNAPQATPEASPRRGRILQGERWHLRGVLVDNYRLPDLSRAEAGGRYMPQRFSFYADSQSVPVLLAPSFRWSLLHWCFFIREKCSVILARGIEHRPDVIAILQGLVLGRQHELPLDMREAFVATGTYHVFAISGQHVAIIALFIVFVLQIYGVGRLKWFYYLAPVLIVFTVMTGMSASAVRGCIMALMCFIGPLFKRKTDISSAMALAALLIVGADPLQLFQAGFLLSFGIVAGLIILCPPLIEMGERRLAPDPYRLEPENRPAQSARKIIRWILFMVIASLAAWLVSTPLIARWFNLVSPIALLANLFIIPLATLVLLAGCLSIAFGWVWPFAAEVFNFANIFFVALMSDITVILARVPFGHVFVKSPPAWFVGLWFIVLLVWRLYYRKVKVWLAAFLILLLAGACAWLVEKKEWEIHVLNIDRGAVCLVKEGGRNFLLNCGPRYQARNILRYLRKNGVNRVQTLFCPWTDSSHAGAAPEISAAIRVNEIIRGTNGVESGKVTVKIKADENAPFAAVINIENVPAPVNVEVQEQEISGALPEFQSDGLKAQYRVVCRPVNEEMTANRSFQILDFQSPVRIDLGPGRGVVFLPDKKSIEIEPVSLYP